MLLIAGVPTATTATHLHLVTFANPATAVGTATSMPLGGVTIEPDSVSSAWVTPAVGNVTSASQDILETPSPESAGLANATSLAPR